MYFIVALVVASAAAAPAVVVDHAQSSETFTMCVKHVFNRTMLMPAWRAGSLTGRLQACNDDDDDMGMQTLPATQRQLGVAGQICTWPGYAAPFMYTWIQTSITATAA
jgi:hypothetical protein